MKNNKEVQAQVVIDGKYVQISLTKEQIKVLGEALKEENKVEINYFQPNEDEYYYMVEPCGVVIKKYKGDSDTRYRAFKTEAEAKKYAKYIRAEETLRRVIAEANQGWTPDWDNNKECKYCVDLNTKNKCSLTTSYYYYTKYQPNFMYIKTEDLASKLREEYEQEFITYLSY